MKIVKDQGHDYQRTENYYLSSDRGIHKGIFFRKPIQKVNLNVYGDGSFSGYDHLIYNYIRKLKNPLFKLYQYILGNKKAIQGIKENIDDMSFYGTSVNILCSPIYFKREYRELNLVCPNHPGIARIHAYGYESPFETVAGKCAKEVAKIYYTSGLVSEVISYQTYDLTYTHRALEFVGYTRAKGRKM